MTKRGRATGSPKVTALKVELAHVESEIEKLMESLLGASDMLISYANNKIAELDFRRQSLIKQLAEFATDEVSPQQMIRVGELLDDWDNASIGNRRVVIDNLIGKISATSGNFDIQWKI